MSIIVSNFKPWLTFRFQNDTFDHHAERIYGVASSVACSGNCGPSRLLFRRCLLSLCRNDNQVVVLLVDCGHAAGSRCAASVKLATPRCSRRHTALPFIHLRDPETGSWRPSKFIAGAINRNQQFTGTRRTVAAGECSGGIAKKDLVGAVPHRVGLFRGSAAVDVNLLRPR